MNSSKQTILASFQGLGGGGGLKDDRGRTQEATVCCQEWDGSAKNAWNAGNAC